MMIEQLPPIQLDLAAHLRNIRREGTPKRVFFFEHGLEPGIKDALCARFDLCTGLDESDPHFLLRREIRIQQFCGLEFMRVFPRGIVWPGLPTNTTAMPPSPGPIRSWRDFEAYAWPRVGHVDFSDLEWFERNLPENLTMWCMTMLFQQVSKRRWGGRVALLGGVDVDFITRRTPDEMRRYTRNILDTCVEGGRFSLGVGNWMADSIPLENYLALLDEARRYET